MSNQADVARRGLVSVNRLDYTLQPDLSVAVARSSKKHFFQQQTYSQGQRGICILNSGAEYIDPQNSYFKFDVRINELAVAETKTNWLELGCGSGINFIKQVILTSRSGDEIERIEQVNQLAPILDRYMNSPDWINTQGEAIGYYNGKQVMDATTAGMKKKNRVTAAAGAASTYNRFGVFEDTGDDAKLPPQSGKIISHQTSGEAKDGSEAGNTFVVPMGCISGLFKSFDRLIPSMLASGLRIEIEFEQANDVGTWRGPNGIPSFTIENLEIVLDQYQLTDSIMRVLNEEAAMRGLEVVFSTWYNHDAAQNTKKNYNVQVRKAVSRALGILTRISRIKGAANALKVDPFLSHNADMTRYQVRVGALYFPQQGIIHSNTSRNNVELYHHTMRGLGKWKTPQAPPGVSLTDYEGFKSYQNDIETTEKSNQSLCCVYTDLERSNTQKLTGIPINNSRVAEIFIDRKNTPMVDARLNSYLHYVRLLRVFLQNVEVEE